MPLRTQETVLTPRASCLFTISPYQVKKETNARPLEHATSEYPLLPLFPLISLPPPLVIFTRRMHALEPHARLAVGPSIMEVICSRGL